MAGAVLIVDDNALMRRTLRNLFMSQPDFDVCGEAENGKQAIDKARILYPDLVVMDISMPVMNGLDAARVLKRMLPTVPIIIFSAYSNCLSEREAQAAGISAVVSKSRLIAALLGEARTLLCRQIAA